MIAMNWAFKVRYKIERDKKLMIKKIALFTGLARVIIKIAEAIETKARTKKTSACKVISQKFYFLNSLINIKI